MFVYVNKETGKIITKERFQQLVDDVFFDDEQPVRFAAVKESLEAVWTLMEVESQR